VLPKPKLKSTRSKHYIPVNHAVPGYVYIFRQPGVSLVKIGLSRNPLIRKERYLEKDYGYLQTVAIVWVFNMKFIEDKMHEFYADRRISREPWKTGFTEWFTTDLTTALEMRICLYLLSSLFNSVVVLLLVFVIAFILFLLFLILR